MKTDEAACQDFADFGDAFVRCHKFWLQWIHDQSPYRRLKMIAPERSEYRNQMISEALRRRKQRSENPLRLGGISVTRTGGFQFDIERQEAIEQQALAIEVSLAVALIRNRVGTML